MAARQATIFRKTNETDIQVVLDLDCKPGSSTKQVIDVSTGIGFLDHVRKLNQFENTANSWHKMYHALAKHGGMSLTLKCKGDLWIDDHHTADEYLQSVRHSTTQII